MHFVYVVSDPEDPHDGDFKEDNENDTDTPNEKGKRDRNVTQLPPLNGTRKPKRACRTHT